MARMTKRERVLRAVAFDEVDRVPVYDILQNDAIIEHYSGMRFAPGNGARITALAVGRALDLTRMAGGPIENPQTVRQAGGFTWQQARWTSWITERPFHDEATAAAWIREDIARADAAVYREEHRRAFHGILDEQTARFAEGDPDGDPTVHIVESLPGLTHMYHSVGHELFAYLLADEPDLIEEWMEALTQAELRRVECVADPVRMPLALTADDIAYKTGPLFSPRWLRSIFMPRLKRLNDAWHERGIACIFHSDGCLWPVMDDLIATGIDGLNPLEVLAGMTPRAVRERYPDLVLTGGIDVSQLLVYGTPEEVRAACRDAIDATGGRGYLIGSSTELHWEVKLENAIAMIDTARETPEGAK
ncbi:MAG: uroporphyrinogen decarboxylase family protein [Acidobacteriota bacterium]|jgi:hypothetical protein|nr:uroporphyrinogen decarboxylase family protein [Acidobacteriota bacterium]